MPAANFNNCIKALYRYCVTPYFRGNLAIPNAQAQREQFFLAIPKDHRSNYGQTSLQVTDTLEELLDNISQCTNLSDKIIRKISNWTKSAIMPAADFKNIIKALYRY